jgi:hypothetical protein
MPRASTESCFVFTLSPCSLTLTSSLRSISHSQLSNIEISRATLVSISCEIPSHLLSNVLNRVLLPVTGTDARPFSPINVWIDAHSRLRHGHRKHLHRQASQLRQRPLHNSLVWHPPLPTRPLARHRMGRPITR